MRILMWEFTDLFGKDYKRERLSDKFLCRNPPPEANFLNVFEITVVLIRSRNDISGSSKTSSRRKSDL